MATTKKNLRQKTIHFRNKKYIGFKRGSSINVKVAQTAQGQLLSAGTFDLTTKTWHDGNRKCPIPTAVMEMFETAFVD